MKIQENSSILLKYIYQEKDISEQIHLCLTKYLALYIFCSIYTERVYMNNVCVNERFVALCRSGSVHSSVEFILTSRTKSLGKYK